MAERNRRTRSPTWVDQRTQEEILEDMMDEFEKCL